VNPFDYCLLDACRHEFMQRALITAFLIGIAAPSIGVFLVQRKLSLMGDGIGHVAFTGVAAGFLTGSNPVLAALVAAVLGALVIEVLRERGTTAGDVALALIFYGGIAGGVLFSGIADEPTTSLVSYLFGSVVLVDVADVWTTAIVAAGVVGITFVLRKELFAVCYDEEVARASGLRVRRLNMLIAITTAITIAVTMKVVGILLVAAMLVLPVAAAQQLSKSFRATVLIGIALGAVESVGGLLVAYYGDLRPAATIVLGAIAAFALCAVAGRVRLAVS
jgi:zinc transport system permease protein